MVQLFSTAIRSRPESTPALTFADLAGPVGGLGWLGEYPASGRLMAAVDFGDGKGEHMWRYLTLRVGLGALAGLLFMQAPAAADHGDISLPIDTVVQAGEGEVVQLAQTTVASELVGAVCSWDLHSENQESVHPGNDLILTTGGSQSVISGVEDVANQALSASGSVELGSTIVVSLRMGPDQVFSAGISVEVVCEESAPAVEPETTTGTTPPASVTPTTEAPAVAGVVVTTPAAPSATVAAAPAVASQGAALAATGVSPVTGWLVASAAALLLAGSLFWRLGARPSS